ncbi:MAG: hypothetical protein ACRC3H_02605 [Lachnospiraceae bacterium]
MKRKTVTTTKEYDKDGKLISEITETVVEEDNGYIYPQYPASPTIPAYHPDWYKVTCTTGD